MSEGFSARRVEVRRGLLAKMTAKENELNAQATRGNLTRGKVPTAGCRAFLQTSANFGLGPYGSCWTSLAFCRASIPAVESQGGEPVGSIWLDLQRSHRSHNLMLQSLPERDPICERSHPAMPPHDHVDLHEKE